MTDEIIIPPTPEQLAARRHPNLLRIAKLIRELVDAGALHATGERKWIEATGRYEIVWDLSPKAKADPAWASDTCRALDAAAAKRGKP